MKSKLPLEAIRMVLYLVAVSFCSTITWNISAASLCFWRHWHFWRIQSFFFLSRVFITGSPFSPCQIQVMDSRHSVAGSGAEARAGLGPFCPSLTSLGVFLTLWLSAGSRFQTPRSCSGLLPPPSSFICIFQWCGTLFSGHVLVQFPM